MDEMMNVENTDVENTEEVNDAEEIMDDEGGIPGGVILLGIAALGYGAGKLCEKVVIPAGKKVAGKIKGFIQNRKKDDFEVSYHNVEDSKIVNDNDDQD